VLVDNHGAAVLVEHFSIDTNLSEIGSQMPFCYVRTNGAKNATTR